MEGWKHSVVSTGPGGERLEHFFTGALEFVRDDRTVCEVPWASLHGLVMPPLMEMGLVSKVRDSYSGAVIMAKTLAAGAQGPGEAKAAYAERVKAQGVTDDQVHAAAQAQAGKVVAKLQAGEWLGERGRAAGPKIDKAFLDFVGDTFAGKIAAPGWAKMKADERRDAANGWLDAKDGRRATVAERFAEEMKRRAEAARIAADDDI